MIVRLNGKPSHHASYVPTGRIWPSGDFSLGYRKVEGDSRVDYRREPNRVPSGPLPPNWSIGRWGIPVQSAESPWAALRPGDLEDWHDLKSQCESRPEHGGGDGVGPLDLTAPCNSHNVRLRPEKYGKKGITGLGKKMVKSAATLMQKMPGKRLTFCTVTMPTLPPELRRELALVWPELVRQLIQWLSRRLKSVGLPPLICSVTEVQPGRLEAYSEAYLHLHLVWINHYARCGNWAISVDLLRTWLSEFLQRKGLWVSDAWVNVDVQRVKKTAAGYLAKYMSKGVAEIEELAKDCGWDAIPGQWWNLSASARNLVKKYTSSGDAVGRLLESVIGYSLAEADLSGFYSLRPAMLEINGQERIVGWFGIMQDKLRMELRSILRDD